MKTIWKNQEKRSGSGAGRLVRLTAVLCMVTLLMGLCACAPATDDSATTVTMEMITEGLTELKAESMTESDITGFYEAIKNNHWKLDVDPVNGDFVITRLSDGEKYYSNPMRSDNPPPLAESVQGKRISSIIVQYTDKISKEFTYTSLDDSVAHGQVSCWKTENSVRLVYTLGRDQSKDLIPPVLDAEAYNGIFEKLTKTEQKNFKAMYILYETAIITGDAETKYDKQELLKKYPALAEKDLYVLREIPGDYKQKQLKSYLEKAGFTYEDMVAQIEAAGYEHDVASTTFTIPLDITLEEGGFRASVDLSMIIGTEGYSLYKMSLLNGLSVTMDARGSFVIPDGAGALMPLYDSVGTVYAKRIYGQDAALNIRDVSERVQATLPLYAVLSEKPMMVAIDDGAALAEVVVHQRSETSQVANAYAQFIVNDRDYQDTSGLTNSQTTLLTGRKPATGTVSVYYEPMEYGADYSDVAVAYREHLQSRGELPNNLQGASTPLVLELFGMVEREKTVLGVKVKVKEALTTFEQAEEILRELKAAGVGPIRVQYRGITNGGMSSTMISSWDFESKLGGKDGFKKLLAYAAENDIEIYPDAPLDSVYSTGWFDGFSSGSDACRRLDSTVVMLGKLSPVDKQPDEILRRYFLKPGKMLENAVSLAESSKNLGLKFVSLAGLGSTLTSDFDKSNFYDRSMVEETVVKALKAFKEDAGTRLMVNGGNLYALPYTDTVIGMASGGSEHSYARTTVPLTYIVMHGKVDYSMQAFNRTGDEETEMLRAIEYGASPYYAMMYAPNTILKRTEYEYEYSLYYKTWMASVVDNAKKISSVLDAVRGKEIADHYMLEDDVYCTVYEDGTAIYVNYKETVYEEGSIRVEARSWTVGKEAVA